MDYTGRVTCDVSQQELIIQGLKDRCDRIIVYRHEADLRVKRPHIHCLMYGVKCSYDTLINVVKRVIPGATKDMYSFPKNKRADDDFIGYMSKGRLDPIYNVGFTDELIAEKKAHGYDKYDRNTNDISVENVLQPKERKTQVTQHMLVVEIATRMVANVDVGPEEEPPYDFEDLYKCTTDVLKEAKKGGDMFYVMKTMESVLMLQYPSVHRQFLKSAWNSRHKISF